MKDKRMGRTQMKIMNVLWEKKRVSAQEITDTINESENVAHSTVQTFLRILLKNKAIAYDVEGRTFIYYPLLEKGEVTRNAVKDFVESIFTGSPEGAVSYIIKNMDVDDSELDRIKEMIDNRNKDKNA